MLTRRIPDRLVDARSAMLAAKDALLPGEFARLYRQVQPYTMCSRARLRGLHGAVRHALDCRIPGDVVECGTARGGSGAMMGLLLRAEPHRTLWLFDTFEGLPPPTYDDPDYQIAKTFVGTCRGDLGDVAKLIEQLRLTAQTRLVKGLFQETVPKSPIPVIAVLHLDGDWYWSVKVCLDHLYDRVSPGGIIQIDDYGHWAGARRAVHDFFRQRGLRLKLKYLDYTGRQFVKPSVS
jgi:hypothetical protein